MNSPLVSIIVPIYNASSYLSRCIESILVQSCPNIELILVDDGSTDGSGTIADSFAEKDKRVSVLHKPNGGVSQARNMGLSRAKGEWVSFVDSDDAINADYVKELLHTATPETDFCLCNFTMTDRNGGGFTYETFCPGKDREESISNLYRKGWIFSIGILFRKSLLTDNRLRFPEHINYTEDVWFITRAIYYARRITKTEKSLYFYNADNQASITHLAHNEKAEAVRMVSMAETISFLQDNHCFDDCRKAVYWSILVWKSWIALCPEQYGRYNDTFIEANKFIWSNPFLSFSMKAMLWLLSHRWSIPAKWLLSVYKR